MPGSSELIDRHSRKCLRDLIPALETDHQWGNSCCLFLCLKMQVYVDYLDGFGLRFQMFAANYQSPCKHCVS